MSEIKWRAVPGYEGLYEASEYGHIRRVAGSPKCRTGRFLKPHTGRSGYDFVSLCRDGKAKICDVHRLIALAFLGPSDLWVNHKNGNKLDNSVSNLEYVTPGENISHAYATGLMPPRQGGSNPRAKLDDATVVQIRAEYASGTSRKALAEKHQISKTTVQGIVTGTSWGHIKWHSTNRSSETKTEP